METEVFVHYAEIAGVFVGFGALISLRSAHLTDLHDVVYLADLRGRVGIYVAGGSLLLAVVGALAVVDVERGAADANITTLGDAFWWAATTMTTVGY